MIDTITLYDLAKLFVIYIFFKYSILSYVTSNCKSKFVSNNMISHMDYYNYHIP